MKFLTNILVILLFILLTTVSLAYSEPILINFQTAKTTKKKLIMGDKISFVSLIKNTGNHTVTGLVGWISLIEITKGHEQPMDLEDWSAHKAISKQILKPGKTIKTIWPMRLIKSGDYRVFVSITTRDASKIITSSSIDFHVNQKPVISSYRVLFVASGIPIILLIYYIFKQRAYRKKINV